MRPKTATGTKIIAHLTTVIQISFMALSNNFTGLSSSSAASIGAPAIPGGGVVILTSVLGSAGIPTEGIIIIIGVERLLGMFRTAFNVTGDLTTCVVFNRFYGNPIPFPPKQKKITT
jgi:Na+/H+-dicarboxylate symporter